MGVDRSNDFTMDNSEDFQGKPNRICPYCKKSVSYNGNKLLCPYCHRRYSTYTITNSQGVKREVN